MAKKDRIKGVVISMPTPTKGKYEIDLPKLKDHITWVIDEGMREGKAVVMAAAGLGTGYFLTRDEQVSVMKATVDAANGKVPTVTGIFDSCTKEAVIRAKEAQDIGIDYLQMNTPHYQAPYADEVFMHYEAVNDGSDCGIIAYNTPWASMNFDITPPLLDRLIKLDNFVSLKWTANDPSNLLNTLKNYSKKVAIIDNSSQSSLAYYLGAKAYIPSFMAHLNPKTELYFSSLLESKQYERFDKERTEILTPFRSAVASVPEFNIPTAGEGTDSHAMFEVFGNPMGAPVLPQYHISKKSVDELRTKLNKIGWADKVKEVGKRKA
ncbi:MAG: dihydrodipicolinate synthase family protein [Thaumarchaeota archaeon]|nr:dihydrodipicolinate synthase family protein [Nitrososphaerota archaeon]